jgi:hypothetical protein
VLGREVYDVAPHPQRYVPTMKAVVHDVFGNRWICAEGFLDQQDEWLCGIAAQATQRRAAQTTKQLIEVGSPDCNIPGQHSDLAHRRACRWRQVERDRLTNVAVPVGELWMRRVLASRQ